MSDIQIADSKSYLGSIKAYIDGDGHEDYTSSYEKATTQVYIGGDKTLSEQCS